ncbi:UNVERIFIED_CONTAM: hypothetical protein FKN15_051892 [Acipenser sinensis]
MANLWPLIYYAQLTATTPALTREGEDERTLSSEACAVSRPLFFTLQTHHAATQELQRRRTTQLSGSLQASQQAPSQTTGVTGARRRWAAARRRCCSPCSLLRSPWVIGHHCAGSQGKTCVHCGILQFPGLRFGRPCQPGGVPCRRFAVPSWQRRKDRPILKPARGRGRQWTLLDLRLGGFLRVEGGGRRVACVLKRHGRGCSVPQDLTQQEFGSRGIHNGVSGRWTASCLHDSILSNDFAALAAVTAVNSNSPVSVENYVENVVI